MGALPNIKYTGDFNKEVSSRDGFESITFNQDKEFFKISENYNGFVKDCERLCRKHEDYARYVNWIKKVLGLDFCQVNPQIHDSDATLEVHHGPLFTLFDYVSVILNYFIDTGRQINTFDVVDQVIQEHYDLHVQTVTLAVTNHEAVHNRDIFLNIKQGFGHLDQFLEQYADHLFPEQKFRVAKYIEISEKTKSFDMHLFDDNAKVKKILAA